MRRTKGMFDGQFPDRRCQAYIAPGNRQCIYEDGHEGDHQFSGANLDEKCPDVIPEWMLK